MRLENAPSEKRIGQKKCALEKKAHLPTIARLEKVRTLQNMYLQRNAPKKIAPSNKCASKNTLCKNASW